MLHLAPTDTFSVIVFKPGRDIMWGSLLCEWSTLFTVTDVKSIKPNDRRWYKHYVHLVGKDFYPNLLDFMMKGYSLIFRAWGDVDRMRQYSFLIRKRHYCEGPDNVIHASENWIEAQREWEVWNES